MLRTLHKHSFLKYSTNTTRSMAHYGPSIHNREQNHLITDGHDHIGEFACVSLKGMSSKTRPKSYNQDAYFYHKSNEFNVFGVCDGHGNKGEFVSDHIARTLSGYIAKNACESNIESYLQQAVDYASNKLKASPVDSMHNGSTLIFSLMANNKLYTANVGDSRAIICSTNNSNQVITKQLNTEHKPQVANERERIYKNGGFVSPEGYVSCRGNIYGIAMSRCLGDYSLHVNGIVIDEPEITTHEIDVGNDFCVIWATDGVWDVLDNEEVGRIAYKYCPNVNIAATNIVKEAKARWLGGFYGGVDDITVVALSL